MNTLPNVKIKRERRAENLSRFHGTKPVIFKPVISGSKHGWIHTKLGDLIRRLRYLDVLCWFEDWLSKASDLRDVLSVWVPKFQNKAVLVDDLFR